MTVTTTAALTDQRFDEIIAVVLRSGVLIAAFFVLLGGVIYLTNNEGPVQDYHVFHSEPPQLRSISGIVQGAFAFRGAALIQFGLLVLIATPIVRVAMSAVVFLYQRDWTYVGVTLLVMALLLYSLLARHS